MNDKIEDIEDYDLSDYPEVKIVKFPKTIHIAYAVCGKQCGNREFIVDGQTQVCEYCGKQMFRTEVKKYKLKGKQIARCKK
jgi:hypothetical protein